MLLGHCWGASQPAAPMLWEWAGTVHSHSLTVPSERRRFGPSPCGEHKSAVAFTPPQRVTFYSFSSFLFGRSQLEMTHPSCSSSSAPDASVGSCSRPPASFCSHRGQAFLPWQTAPRLVKRSLILAAALQINRQTSPHINRCEGGSERLCKHLPVPSPGGPAQAGML